MAAFLNSMNRCWLMYLIGGLVLFGMIDRSMIDRQYLNSYKGVATVFVNCVPFSCSPKALNSGLSYYSHWVDLFPGSMEANNAIGYCFYHLHQYRRSLEYFTRAIDLQPQDATLYYNQSLALLRSGDYFNALMALKKGAATVTQQGLLKPNVIFPVKTGQDLDPSAQAALIYYFTVFKYEELISLTDQLNHSADGRQKKILIDTINRKISSLELFYYVPMFKATVQGKEFVLI